jgi:Xaa-Pro aminopeptidase
VAEAPEAAALEEYAGRRARLVEQLKAPVVLFGYTGREEIALEETFRQEPNFFFLTGHAEPGAALLLLPKTDAARAAGLAAETLYLPPRNLARERWEGQKLGPEDKDTQARTGFAAVKPMVELRGDLERALRVFPQLYTLFPEAGAEPDATFAGRKLAWLRAISPQTEFADARAALGAMRQVKSERELALLKTAIERSLEAHREALRALRPGMYEYEIAALMKYTFERAGCKGPGYTPIVGSGPNSTVLHYSANRRRMEAGELVVMDVGAECAGYVADVTRTLPVGGRFTPRQREIYEIVLGAQNAALAAVKPGMTFARTWDNSLYKVAYDYINSHGKDAKGQPLGQYFIHGLGHHIGLEVHDAGERYRPLEPGMVVTIEPGIYIPEESLGVRIEDIVLVTKDGGLLLTASLPRTVEEVERAMAQKQNRKN